MKEKINIKEVGDFLLKIFKIPIFKEIKDEYDFLTGISVIDEQILNKIYENNINRKYDIINNNNNINNNTINNKDNINNNIIDNVILNTKDGTLKNKNNLITNNELNNKKEEKIKTSDNQNLNKKRKRVNK